MSAAREADAACLRSAEECLTGGTAMATDRGAISIVRGARRLRCAQRLVGCSSARRRIRAIATELELGGDDAAELDGSPVWRTRAGAERLTFDPGDLPPGNDCGP
jgi:hypothetical protein